MGSGLTFPPAGAPEAQGPVSVEFWCHAKVYPPEPPLGLAVRFTDCPLSIAGEVGLIDPGASVITDSDDDRSDGAADRAGPVKTTNELSRTATATAIGSQRRAIRAAPYPRADGPEFKSRPRGAPCRLDAL